MVFIQGRTHVGSIDRPKEETSHQHHKKPKSAERLFVTCKMELLTHAHLSHRVNHNFLASYHISARSRSRAENQCCKAQPPRCGTTLSKFLKGVFIDPPTVLRSIQWDLRYSRAKVFRRDVVSRWSLLRFSFCLGIQHGDSPDSCINH